MKTGEKVSIKSTLPGFGPGGDLGGAHTPSNGGKTKRCLRCGTLQKEDTRFCENCGCPMGGGTEEEKPPKKKPFPLWIPVAVVMVICAVAGVILIRGGLGPRVPKPQAESALAEIALNYARLNGIPADVDQVRMSYVADMETDISIVEGRVDLTNRGGGATEVRVRIRFSFDRTSGCWYPCGDELLKIR